MQERLGRFGKVAACRLVMDKGTRKLKGTAFVEFQRQEDAAKAVTACATARHVSLGKSCKDSGPTVYMHQSCNGQSWWHIALQGWAGPAGAGEGDTGGGGHGPQAGRCARAGG